MGINLSTHHTVQAGEKLSAFVQHEDFPVDIKDCSGKYTENNRLAAGVSGLAPQDRIGLDIYDLARIHQMPQATLEKIVQADHAVITYKEPVSLMHVFLDHTTQCIVVDRVLKRPIVNQHSQMIGILSYAQDMIPYIKRTYLYLFYKHYYPIEEAIKKFITHMKLTHFFGEMPTEEELNLLLHHNQPITQVAQILALPLQEVIKHQKSLQNKIIMIDYEALIERCSAQSDITEPL